MEDTLPVPGTEKRAQRGRAVFGKPTGESCLLLDHTGCYRGVSSTLRRWLWSASPLLLVFSSLSLFSKLLDKNFKHLTKINSKCIKNLTEKLKIVR